MIHLYLDQFAWIELARAAHERPGATEAAADALAVLREGVQRRLVSCPLSSYHYMETLTRLDPGSRRRLAVVMAELSGFDAIASSGEVLRAELDYALRRRFRKEAAWGSIEIFGNGVGFAFGQPELGMYRLPKEAGGTRQQRRQVEWEARQLMQMAILMGPVDGPLPGVVENDGYRSFGQRYVAGEKKLASGIVAYSSTQGLDDWIAASIVTDILDPINEALDRARIGVDESRELESKEGLTALLFDLPSRHVVYELRRGRHGNPQTKWEGNDLEDLEALAVAIPYCDAVVTEKQWVHFARRAKLDDRYGTHLLPGLRQLPAFLSAES